MLWPFLSNCPAHLLQPSDQYLFAPVATVVTSPNAWHSTLIFFGHHWQLECHECEYAYGGVNLNSKKKLKGTDTMVTQVCSNVKPPRGPEKELERRHRAIRIDADPEA